MSEKINAGLPEIFGSRVFNENTMKERLSGAVFKKWKNCVTTGSHLDSDTADEVAEAMKQWAIEKGATHYTHWFQPMTGVTAEKHDSFVSPCGGGRVIMEFSGKELIKGEPDASSFPSGGLRATFEARGYTAWDPASFAFVNDDSLYIPTIFCSYGGHSLDKKMPLLKSMDALNKQALRILKLFGDTTTKRVIAQCGPEQEYFLVDQELYNKREDLKLCGRTLFGNKPPRGQELDDHYYGQLKPRVAEYMRDLDNELWKMGVISKTKHNEVAPSQHEIAPVYLDVNQASDQNQLTMATMKKVAKKHGFHCLLNEKPYKGINGSGKHDNWSLATDTGINLLKPGSTPSQNAQFLVFLAAFIKGVDEYPETLRAAVAHAGNDHRLGAQEAPPAVISIFLGDELEEVVEAIINDKNYKDKTKKALKIGVDMLPTIRQDNTDRNRTSPMAFTGNKFEFRMLGSSQSVSGPNIAINTIMAQELKEIADKLEESRDFQNDLHKLIKKMFIDHQRIIFNGNGYDESWIKEAEKRGLVNLKYTADALEIYDCEKNIKLYEDNAVFTAEELHARANIHILNYNNTISIEANTMVDMIRRQILPAVSSFASELCKRLASMEDVGVKTSYEKKTAIKLASLTDELMDCVEKLESHLLKVPDSPLKAMRYYHKTITEDMKKARNAADQLELITDARYWPFPVYADLLFSE